MKKFFLALLLLLMLIPSLCFAVNPTIRSDSRTFNPLSGIYNLQGHVFVQFPVKDSDLTITGDTTEVHLYSLEVHGAGNITLSFGDLHFYCDKVDVYHSDSTAYVTDNLRFEDDTTKITADSGAYSWKTKLAAFHGNVKVNGQAYDEDVLYNVMEKKIVPPEPASAAK